MSAQMPARQRQPLGDSYEGLYNRARSLYMAGDVEEALKLYRRLADRLGRLTDRVLRLRPELEELRDAVQNELLSVLYQIGRYAEAIEVLDAIIEREPKDIETLRRDRAVLSIMKGEVDAGLADLQALAEAAPEDPMNWLVLGTEARIAGRLAESRTAFDGAQEAVAAAGAEVNDETLAQIEYQRFLLLKELGRLDDAIDAWESAVQHDSDFATTVRDVYTELTEAGRYSDALEYVAREENELQEGFQRGIIASATGRQIDARDAWREVAALDPDEFNYGHDAWVEAVLRLGDPTPALEWLSGALSDRPTPRLLFLAGVAWAMQGDRELALQALLLDPMINDIDTARAILADFLSTFAGYLPQFA